MVQQHLRQRGRSDGRPYFVHGSRWADAIPGKPLDSQGEIAESLDKITIGADVRMPAQVAQALKAAAQGWQIARAADGSVTLTRPPMDPAILREVGALYERVGVREGEDSEKAQQIAATVVRDITNGLRARVRTESGNLVRARRTESGIRTLGIGIRAELTHRGRVEFRGKKVKTAEDLAVIAQIVRNPQVEVFCLFVRSVGKSCSS